MSLDQWPAAFRAAGLSVQLHNGFPNTSKPQGSLNSPLASLYIHHDATPAGPTPGALNWIIDSYNSGSPSAQLWLDTSGIWHFCGAGVASHAGVVRGGLTNKNSVGVETDHTVNETYPAPMMASLLKGCAVACKVEGRQADFITFHKIEASPRGRKQDPWLSQASNTQANWDKELADFRAKVQLLLSAGIPATPDTNPEPEEGFMAALTDNQQKEMYYWLQSLNANEQFSPPLSYNKTATNFNDVRALAETVQKLAEQVNWLHMNEQFDPPLGYSKTAANFNDVRALQATCAEILAILKGSTPDPGTKTYTVVSGDTFTGIASKLGVSVDALKAANPQVTDINDIAVGQVLNVPKA